MQRFRSILCVADLGEARERVLGLAVDLAERHRAGLTVLDVIEPLPTGWPETDGRTFGDALERARAERLDAALAPFAQRLRIDRRTVRGIPFLRIVREVLRGGHDLVIRQCEDPDWLDRTLGSDDVQLLRECPCPVWLVDPSAPLECRRVLAAVDVDRHYPAAELETRHALNRRTLDLACATAIAGAAELHIVYAWRAPVPMAAYPGMPVGLINDYVARVRAEHTEALEALVEETRAAVGADAWERIGHREHLIDGSPRREIPALARRLGIELVVMGSVARTGVPGFIVGNTAEMILGQLDCSVLVVKPPGFVTPVTLEG